MKKYFIFSLIFSCFFISFGKIYSYVNEINVYKSPEGKIVIIFPDKHSIGTKDENMQQMLSFLDFLIISSAKFEISILLEAALFFKINFDDPDILQKFNMFIEEIYGVRVEEDAHFYTTSSFFPFEFPFRLLNLKATEQLKNVKVESVDPRLSLELIQLVLMGQATVEFVERNRLSFHLLWQTIEVELEKLKKLIGDNAERISQETHEQLNKIFEATKTRLENQYQCLKDQIPTTIPSTPPQLVSPPEMLLNELIPHLSQESKQNIYSLLITNQLFMASLLDLIALCKILFGPNNLQFLFCGEYHAKQLHNFLISCNYTYQRFLPSPKLT